MTTIIRYLNKKAQGIVEYALLLAFIVGLGMMLNGANLSGAVKGTFDSVASVLASFTGGENGNNYASALATWGTWERNKLHDYGEQGANKSTWGNYLNGVDTGTDIINNDERLAADYAGLENIANNLIGKQKSDLPQLLNYSSLKDNDYKNSVQLFTYGDRWESANTVYFRNVRASPEWLSGDYSSVSSSYASDYNGKNQNTRYFYSNGMIEPNGKETTFKSSYTFDKYNANGSIPNDAKVTSVRIWAERNGQTVLDKTYP